jgi:transglutaminase-like putative cysteine protease
VDAKSHRIERLGENECLRVTPQGTNRFRLEAKVTLTPISYQKQAKAIVSSNTYPEEARRYLLKIKDADPNLPMVLSQARQLKGDSPCASIENVLNWCNANLKYIATEQADAGGGNGEDVLKRKSGHCEGRTTGAVSLLKACGIPARYIRGHGAVVGKAGHGSWHTITEYYLVGIGWIPWDYDYEPFVVRPTYLSTFHYDSPHAAPGRGDRSVIDLWNFQALGPSCEFVNFKLLRSIV